MELGVAKLAKNEPNTSGPIGREASEYIDVWIVTPTGQKVPLRLTLREFDTTVQRAEKQRSEIAPLRLSIMEKLFGVRNAS